MEDGTSTVSFCPSFNSYYSESDRHLVNIAARVCREEEEQEEREQPLTNGNHSDSDDFEFGSVRVGHDINSDCVFPLFNRVLLTNHGGDERNQCPEDSVDGDNEVEVESIRLPMRQLFLEDRDLPSSCSSSEVDELEGVSPATYCVWTPRLSPSVSPSPGRCNKSNSTGSSTKPKWRLRDLLKRSSSDGKVVFLHHPNNDNNQSKITPPVKAKAKAKEKLSAHEVFYVRSKALKEGEKRRSYLPYRQDLVGLFATVPRTLPPF